MPQRPVRLIASDLDGTLIPPPSAPDPTAGVATFREAARRAGLPVAYVTGRDHSLALAGIEAAGLPEPDWLICDVGTQIFHRRGGGLWPDPRYRDRMVEAFQGLEAEAIRKAVTGLHGLVLQPEAKQGEFKVSFTLPPSGTGDPPTSLRRDLMERLGGMDAPVAVVWSVDVEDGAGLVDILPRGVAKDRALRHLQEEAGMAMDQVVYAGDSGNDLAALLAGFRAVLVGNAPAPLRVHVREESGARGLEEEVYLARGHYGDGVVEGLRHFGVAGDGR